MHSHDIIIVGGGLIGATLALTLAKTTSLSIGLLEANPVIDPWSVDAYAHRVSAITLSSQRLYKYLDIWSTLEAKRVSPFTKINVWDATGSGEISFDSQDIAEPFLGYIIENNLIQSALLEKIRAYPQIDYFCPVTLSEMIENDKDIVLTSADGCRFKAKLAIAADGAQSWLRSQLPIEVSHHDYEQYAIVATVQTEKPHQHIARQAFLAGGPLAFLPLASQHTSSIVWSLPISEAKALMASSIDEFKRALTSAFDGRLGEIVEVSKRYSFPLYSQEAKRYISSRIALVGDAAHTLHPLAGQGINMGLLDAASLAEVIHHAIGQNRDFSSMSTLRKYERWRKADNLGLLTGIDMIKNIFASKRVAISGVRALGMNTANHLSWIKNIFMRHAVGARTGLPKIMNQPTQP